MNVYHHFFYRPLQTKYYWDCEFFPALVESYIFTALVESDIITGYIFTGYIFTGDIFTGYIFTSDIFTYPRVGELSCL